MTTAAQRSELEGARPVLPLRLEEVDEVLPEGGLPRGAVVELAAPAGLARSTSLALAACASAQAEAKLRGGEATAGAWCAWIEPGTEASVKRGSAGATLFAPAVARAGVDLDRLLVVRPPLDALAKVAARVASSGVFAVIVIDLAGVPGQRTAPRLDRWVNAVRRLALAVEGSDTTVLLLTDGLAPRAVPLPVALRLELDRLSADRLMLRVGKDRRGRVSPARAITLARAGAENQTTEEDSGVHQLPKQGHPPAAESA